MSGSTSGNTAAPANRVRRDLFPTPFSTEYWRLAASELKSTRMLVLAAIITAMRVGVKMLSIPIAADLNITFGFIFNSVGSMIYGPVMAILASAVSDTLGAILFPSGTYFFPFIFVEIAGGLLFALFFYRAEITGLRVILGRFSVTLVCNIILNPLIMIPYRMLIMGSSYNFLSLPRMIKNLALFPLEALIMVVLFNAILPVTNRFGFTFMENTRLKLNKKEIITLVILTVVSALAIVVYCLIVDLL